MKGGGIILALKIILGILLSILILIFLLLLIKIKLNIILDGELKIYLKVLFLKIRLFPSKKKQKKKKPKDKEEKPKKEKKPKEKVAEDGEEKPKPSIFDYIKIICDVVKLFFKKFAKHFHIKLAKIHVRVATGDAASTAILYGAISQSLAYLIATLNAVTRLDGLKRADILIYPDYLSDKFEAKINITFGLRLIGVVDAGLRSLFRFLKLQKRAKAVRAAKMKAKAAKKESLDSSVNNTTNTSIN